MIKIDKLCHRFGNLPVLDNLSCCLESGRISCLLGPSGCGKTTLLNLMAGILPVQKGSIRGLPPETPACVFQESRLLPWKTLAANIEIVIPRTHSSQDRMTMVNKLLDMVDLRNFADYYPHELSGGMRQRGAMARAFALPSTLLLMDEPFQALDPDIKIELMEIFRQLWDKDRRTVLFVTHNLQEATLLGDSILVLSRRPASLLICRENPIAKINRKPYTPEIIALEQELFRTMESCL